MDSQIAKLNDQFRRSSANDVYLTAGIATLPMAGQQAIVRLVRTFDAFTPENDPYGEHDFGSFEYLGQTIFWKIDCYDMKLEWGSSDSADPSVTRRVLTIMLAEEY
jgi:hypothetical protein